LDPPPPPPPPGRKFKKKNPKNEPCSRTGWSTQHFKERVRHIQKLRTRQQLSCNALNYEGEAQ
jgi:hypothetical protein